MRQTNKIVGGVIIIVIVGGLGMYFWQRSAANTNKNTSPSATTQNNNTAKKVASDGTYQNTTYGFSLVFPKNWGNVQEKVGSGPANSKIYKTVRLTAENDVERYIQIQIVKLADENDPSVKDYPQTYLAANATYSFYYSGSGDYAGTPGKEDQKYFDIQNEVNAIGVTFKLP